MSQFNLATKLFMAMITLNLLLFAVIFIMPPELYSKIMHEPDCSFFNLEALTFILFCDLAFYIGYFLYSPIVIKYSRNNPSNAAVSNKFIILPLVPFIFLTAVSVMMILKAYPQLLFSLGSSAAQRLRADVGTQQDVMSGAPIILSGMVWWAVFKMRRTELIVKKRLRITRVVIAISMILLTLTFFIKMSRMELIPLFVGLLINYKYAEYVTFKGGRTDLLRSMVVVIAIGLAIFIVLSLLRGYGDWQEIFRQIFAYGPASYNRLSAFLSGRLHFYGENTGIYVSSFQGQIPILKHFVDIYSVLGQPNLNSAWLRDFKDVAHSGLNTNYTFPTVYGAVYSFFGLLSPFYFLALGLFLKHVVHSINKEKIFGIVFFPFVLFSMLFLFGWNFVLSYNFIVLVITVFILFSYEVVFLSIIGRRRPRHHGSCRLSEMG